MTPITELRELLTKAALPPNEATAHLIRVLPKLLDVAEAAKGLSTGQDWNNGTMAKTHGYRQRLLDALAKLEAAK